MYAFFSEDLGWENYSSVKIVQYQYMLLHIDIDEFLFDPKIKDYFMNLNMVGM